MGILRLSLLSKNFLVGKILQLILKGDAMNSIGSKVKTLGVIAVVLTLFHLSSANAENYQPQVTKLENWLSVNKDQATGLPHSHVGDGRFDDWAITYDSAVTTLAYIAVGNINDAKRILDFYIQTPKVWRLDGIIEAVNPTGHSTLGEDWAVRTGSNLWMGMAGFHLYKATGDVKYLDLARRLADFAISLQSNDEKDTNFGGISLGPQGDKAFPNDQHLGGDASQISFFKLFATEHNVDAYALFNMLYQETKDKKYQDARDGVLRWLKYVGYNKEEHRFNRGCSRVDGVDTVVATDVHTWGISALGVEELNTFESEFAEKVVNFIEKNCLSEVSYVKPNKKVVRVRGVDFIDRKLAADLGRKPMVSPEWTFQLINAYGQLADHFERSGDVKKAGMYRQKRQVLIKSMLDLAVDSNDMLAYPYATQADAVVGHEYNTPRKGNLSTIGVAYGILALTAFDPLVVNTK